MVLGCLVAAVLVLSGCGGNQNLAVVTGRVTLNGQPLPKAFVTFVPQDGKGAPAFGKTDADGRYQMMFSDTQTGAWVGKNLVRISTADAISPEKTIPEQVPVIYNTKSDLIRTVEQGKNQFDFDLKSDGPIAAEAPYTG